jgi:amidohydrolase
MSAIEEKIVASVDAVKDVVVDVAKKIHANPELKYEERRAAGWLCEALEQAGLTVERGVGGVETAFRARTGRPDAGAAAGPRVAILAEYDALPEIGHACGHNLIAGSALGAFLALHRVSRQHDLGGEVVLLGTPAEEGGGGKIKLLEAGAFDGLDATMMFHPLDRDVLAQGSLASEWITFDFTGSPSHAAAAPWAGRNALQGVIQTFNLVDGQRVHFRDGTRVHGFITNGGQAVNIIPERAECRFSVRAPSDEMLAELVERVLDCARGAAMATRTTVSISRQKGYRDLRNNVTLARAFGRHLSSIGRVAADVELDVRLGSTDLGDVSHVVPSIHPYLGICAPGEAMCHEHPFTAVAGSDRGLVTMIDAAKALACTAAQLLADDDLRTAVRTEHETRRTGR